jgi:hypothetical protein
MCLQDIAGADRASATKAAGHASTPAPAAECVEAQAGSASEPVQSGHQQQQAVPGIRQPSVLATEAALGTTVAAASGSSAGKPDACPPQEAPAFVHLRRPPGRWSTACWIVCLPW